MGDNKIARRVKIEPSPGTGGVKLGMSKDAVLKKLGKPEVIHWKYQLAELAKKGADL